MQKAKSNYYQSIINNNINNPKQMWKSVNSIRGKAKGSKTTNISSLKVGDEIVEGDKEIADNFNSYFVNVGSILSKDLLESKKSFCDYVNWTTNTFAFNEIFQNDTFKLLCGLKESKASGPDRLYAGHIKDSADIICPALTQIFNRSLQLGIFPEDLKNAFLSPIFKSANKCDCSNYRPISVSWLVAKLFEKIIYNQLNTHMLIIYYRTINLDLEKPTRR